MLNINDDNIKFIITEFDYWNFIECHNLKLQNQTFKIINDADITLDFIDNINLENYKLQVRETRKCLLVGLTNTYKKYLENIETNNIFCEHYTEIYKNFIILMNKICEDIGFHYNYEKYFVTYKSKIMKDINHTRTEIYKLINLQNVYYKNRVYYDTDWNEIIHINLKNDHELCKANKSYITNKPTEIHIKDNILCLDYFYDHYNFGEFIDVLKRLLYIDESIPDIKLLRLRRTDVKDIDYYFSKFDFIKETLKLIQWNDVTTTFKLDNVYINTCCSKICRNYISKMTAFLINEKFNTCELSNEKLKLFLYRDKKRQSVNNKYFFDELHKRNFIFINGSETLEQIIYFFTNASIIVGEHGSLFQNTYFCKRHPFIIEISPLKFGDHMVFHGHSVQREYIHLLFFLDAINLENEIEGSRGPLHIKYDDITLNKILKIIDTIII